jgi:WD40 repeat protein
MIYCLAPNCQKPQNPDATKFCLTCGSQLLLKNRYRAIDFLGAGGMGKNFLAVDEDTPSKKRCVIKQFCPDIDIQRNTAAFEKAIELFNREAAQLDQLGDKFPQIPQLLAHIEQDKRLYFVQEFIDGQDLLKELAQRGTYNEAQIYHLLNDLLPVLKFIHDRGVIHRDIKPENIICRLRDNQLVLIDFGISKQLSGTVMSMGTTVGTLGYAPPEQMTYGEGYPASDLYALGATCIHLLTDVEPHQLYKPMENSWLWQDVLASRGASVSSHLAQILDKMLKADIRERWRSVDEVLAVLNSVNASRKPISFATPTILNYTSFRCIHSLKGHFDAVFSVAFSPDGQNLASCSGFWDTTIKLWDVGTGQELWKLYGHSKGIRFVTFSPDGQTLASASMDKTIKLWDVETGKNKLTLRGHSDSVFSIAFSPDGQTLASGSKDKTIQLWNVNANLLNRLRGKNKRSLKGHSDTVFSVAFSLDGQNLASCSGFWDKNVKLWDVFTGQKLRTFSGHSDGVRSVAFSPDGQILASGSSKVEKNIKLWDVSTGNELHTLAGHSSWVSSVAFSPDGQTLASGSGDKTIKLWNAITGQELCTLEEHSNEVLSVAFSLDGQTLASGCRDKTIKIWRCD